MEAAVDDVKAVRDAAVAGEGEHHAGVGRLGCVCVSVAHAFDFPFLVSAKLSAKREGGVTYQAEKTAMPDTKHDEDHEHQSTSFAACVCQDFEHW